jgi:hypothetical protein
MTNDISETNVEEAVPCIALSKNDSYVMSASGGKVSLFNMMTFKVNLFFCCIEVLLCSHRFALRSGIFTDGQNLSKLAKVYIVQTVIRKLGKSFRAGFTEGFLHMIMHQTSIMQPHSMMFFSDTGHDNIHATSTCSNISCISSSRQ